MLFDGYSNSAAVRMFVLMGNFVSRKLGTSPGDLKQLRSYFDGLCDVICKFPNLAQVSHTSHNPQLSGGGVRRLLTTLFNAFDRMRNFCLCVDPATAIWRWAMFCRARRLRHSSLRSSGYVMTRGRGRRLEEMSGAAPPLTSSDFGLCACGDRIS